MVEGHLNHPPSSGLLGLFDVLGVFCSGGGECGGGGRTVITEELLSIETQSMF